MQLNTSFTLSCIHFFKFSGYISTNLNHFTTLENFYQRSPRSKTSFTTIFQGFQPKYHRPFVQLYFDQTCEFGALEHQTWTGLRAWPLISPCTPFAQHICTHENIDVRAYTLFSHTHLAHHMIARRLVFLVQIVLVVQQPCAPHENNARETVRA